MKALALHLTTALPVLLDSSFASQLPLVVEQDLFLLLCLGGGSFFFFFFFFLFWGGSLSLRLLWWGGCSLLLLFFWGGLGGGGGGVLVLLSFLSGGIGDLGSSQRTAALINIVPTPWRAGSRAGGTSCPSMCNLILPSGSLCQDRLLAIPAPRVHHILLALLAS